MNTNKELAERFEQISQMLEVLGENRFRVGAYERAARAMEGLSEDVAEVAQDRKRLEAIEGVGKKTADKIIHFLETGKMPEHEELQRKVPLTLLDIVAIPGVGPKTTKAIWDTLGVTDLAGLHKAIEDGSILDVPRMGEKTVENMKASLKFVEGAGDRLWVGQAMPVARGVVQRLAKLEGVERVAYAGSLRRGRETIGDVDVLLAGADPASAARSFRDMPEVEQVLVAGATKSSVRVRVGRDLGRWTIEGEHGTSGGPALQIDLRVVPEESWGAALLYFTGSKAHNVRLRERALRKKLTLNEYGLFPLDDDDTPPQSRGVKPVASKTEEEIYEKLDLPWIPPELREDRGELELTETPKLVEVDDIKAELHAHTNASDGGMPLGELVKQAKSRGFHTIAVTDHSQSSVQANGLQPERLRKQMEKVRELNGETKGIEVLTGSEVDILADGRLDYDDDLLTELDIVVASPHASLAQDSKKATARLLKAIEHPLVHILGHPTGRLINRRKGLEPDMSELIAAAKEHDVALEINAHWMRLDLRDTHVRAAVEAGCLIAIDCDVHTPDDFDNLPYGIATGRRGALPAERCVNTWSKAKLGRWLKSKRG